MDDYDAICYSKMLYSISTLQYFGSHHCRTGPGLIAATSGRPSSIYEISDLVYRYDPDSAHIVPRLTSPNVFLIVQYEYSQSVVLLVSQ